jgi:hypothetical protein
MEQSLNAQRAGASALVNMAPDGKSNYIWILQGTQRDANTRLNNPTIPHVAISGISGTYPCMRANPPFLPGPAVSQLFPAPAHTQKWLDWFSPAEAHPQLLVCSSPAGGSTWIWSDAPLISFPLFLWITKRGHLSRPYCGTNAGCIYMLGGYVNVNHTIRTRADSCINLAQARSYTWLCASLAAPSRSTPSRMRRSPTSG